MKSFTKKQEHLNYLILSVLNELEIGQSVGVKYIQRELYSMMCGYSVKQIASRLRALNKRDITNLEHFDEDVVMQKGCMTAWYSLTDKGREVYKNKDWSIANQL